MTSAAFSDYQFIEVAMGCTNVEEMEEFWQRMFDARVIFRGRMMGFPFSRFVACGTTFVFREDPAFKLPKGPGEEFQFCNHLGLRVHDLEASIRDLEGRGAKFVMTPRQVRELQKTRQSGGGTMLETTYIAAPLTAERIANGEFSIEVAILAGPDNLWIELNQVKEPGDTRWFG